MSSIVIKGNTSGQIELAAPDVAGTNTITLPASSGTLLDSTSTLDATLLTGDLPAISGANLTGLPAGGFSNMDVITSTSTWTNPGSISKVKVTVVGGGGSANGDDGGGAGGTAIEIITFAAGTNVSVTIGAGGSASAGGTTSFGAYCSATGGARGTGTIGGDGGTGVGGDLNMRGGAAVGGAQGIGGASFFGGSGRASAQAGIMGGGGGGINGLGGAGIVVVEY